VATAYTIETKEKHEVNAMVKEDTCNEIMLQVSLGRNLKVFARIVVFRPQRGELYKR
jgi:hypothetical protein